MLSPIIRQFHQVTRFVFPGTKAPGLLYVTDGGVQDCTAIIQLMRRRCARILLVLANADPDDELLVLRTTMDGAVSLKLGSFYDPKDPKRDVKVLLEEYQRDKAIGFLHIGIRYGWEGAGACEEKPALGTLVIVKNRLPA